MITFGWTKEYRYNGDGTLWVKVRIPSIHGAYSQTDYRGRLARNYTQDIDLPWYQSILLPHLPQPGEVVALSSLNPSNTKFLVIGLTGGFYTLGQTNIGG